MAKSFTCLAQAFLILYLVFFLFSFFQFFLSISPLFVLTLTADAHCSGKLGSGRKRNKYSTKPKGFLCTPSAQHIHMCYTFFFTALPKSRRSQLPSWMKTFLSYILIDYCTVLIKLFQMPGCAILWTARALQQMMMSA